MAEKALTEVLGAGTTQTDTELRISKTGLAALLTANGYTFAPSASNSPDQLIAAIICAGLITMKAEDREADPANRNVEFSYDPAINYDSPTINGQSYSRHVVSVGFYKAIPTPTLNPSDF
jgi:hypothetical protein